jgi:hypothetical protein
MPSPYRLQIFLEYDVRDALKDIAHEERTSLQELVSEWLLDKIHDYPQHEAVGLTPVASAPGRR